MSTLNNPGQGPTDEQRKRAETPPAPTPAGETPPAEVAGGGEVTGEGTITPPDGDAQQ